MLRFLTNVSESNSMIRQESNEFDAKLMPSLTLGSVRMFGSLGYIEGPPDLLAYPFSKSVSIRHIPRLLSRQPPRVFLCAVTSSRNSHAHTGGFAGDRTYYAVRYSGSQVLTRDDVGTPRSLSWRLAKAGCGVEAGGESRIHRFIRSPIQCLGNVSAPSQGSEPG